MKYVFKISYLRNILIVSSIIAIALPICIFLFVFPSFTKMLKTNAEDEALRLARHMNSMIIGNQTELSRNSLNVETLQEAKRLKKQFELMKLKIFSKSGEIIYSTEPKDIGKINKKRYFHDSIAKGEVYTKLVKKNTPSLEGQIVNLDVVETYVPIIKNGAVIGALEIYYDITDRKARLDKLVFISRITLSILAFILLGVIMIVLIKAGKTISRRKQADEALRESEERYEALFERSLELVYLCDFEGNFIDANDTAIKLLGYTREDITSLNFSSLLDEDQLLIALKTVEEILKTGSQRDVMEYKLRRKDGKYIYVESKAAVIYRDGKPFAIQGIARNITDRKFTEESLKESEEKYRKLFTTVSDAIIIFDTDTNEFVDVNDAAIRLYGYSKEEFLCLRLPDITAELEKSIKTIEQVLSGETTGVQLRYHKKKDGTVFPVEISAGILKLKNREFLCVVIRDLTERKRAEEERRRLGDQLQQAQKMESIGTLAGGIAHDFNNILSPIMIHSEMAMEALPNDSPLQFNLKEIFKAGDRARNMVKQILAFSRKKEPERTAIKMSSILKEVVKLLRASIPSTIEIRQHIKAEVDTVFADPTQIHQVILNLCTNASQAMRDKGGMLEIEIDDLHLDPEAAGQFKGLIPGSYLRMTVRDTGDGIDPEIIGNIFDPYFTTKEVGEGTGMGLSAAHGIMTRHSGDITVESKPGKGTTFQLLFPKYEEGIPEVSKDTALLLRGTERILFVDDEKGAVDAIKPMLENLGYDMTARTSSIETLEAFRNNPDRFDLVITDMAMPNMTGKELTKELLSIRQDIPVILCTGFSEQIDEYKAKEMGINAYVMKPIVMREMAQTIREVLDKK